MWGPIIANVWWGIPFFAITLLAALQAIPRDLYEAASIDGANAFQRFWSITLPFLAPTIAITILLRTVWISNFADLIIVMTNGGPADRTQIVASYIFTQAFRRLDFGYASAIALVLLLAADGLFAADRAAAPDHAEEGLMTRPKRIVGTVAHRGAILLYILFALFPLYLAAEGLGHAQRPALQRGRAHVAVARQHRALPVRAGAQRLPALLPQQPDRLRRDRLHRHHPRLLRRLRAVALRLPRQILDRRA